MNRAALTLRRATLIAGAICLALALDGIVTPADAAPGCRRPQVSGAAQAIDPGRINQRLLNAAVLAEVNYLRCRKGLSGLAPTAGLRRAAEGHAKWMARARNLSHVTNIRGKRTPSERIISAGGKVRMGSENIAKVSLYRLDEFGSFRITNAANCQFAASNGARIGRHSYESLARYVASLWYNSRGHRKNMMDGRARLVGTAAGFDPRARNCGQIYISQAIAG